MQVHRQHDELLLTASPLEARLLRQVVNALLKNYRLAPSQIDPKIASAWYSTRGCASARLSPEETREWLQHLHGFKSARLRLLEQCRAQLASWGDAQGELRLRLEDGAELMAALNDHRLWLAAQHDINQEEMDIVHLADFERLTSARRNAVLEIHFLAQWLHEILEVVSPDAAHWLTGYDPSL